jgi:translation initiation factor 1 (eIF-1/SUI1)
MPPKAKLPACGFFVTVNETDHSVPIKVKKVAKGKKVSVLSKITGSRTAAVNTLKQLLGVGGELSSDQQDAIELQGDQTGRIATTLRNLDALRGEPTQLGPTVVVPSKQGFEKFMKQKNLTASPAPPQSEEMSQACIIVHGRYWPYCNGNCQLCPPLTDVFEGVDVYCSWFDPSDNVREKISTIDDSKVPEMTKEEIDAALGQLGMRAEVGDACKSYLKEKNMKPWLLAQEVRESVTSAPITKSEKPRPAPPKTVRKQLVDRPVRVIMNRKLVEEEDSEYYVLHVSLKDISQWMSQYEYFVVSLLAETAVILANHEMVDSRTLKLLFFHQQSASECERILEDVMPNFFEFKLREPTQPFEEVVQPPEEEEPDFEQMAIDLGLDENTEFWKKFTELIDESDGTQEGILAAFQSAVLFSTS